LWGRLAPLTRRLVLAGFLLVATSLTLAITQARLGSPLFFPLAALIGLCQIFVLLITRNAPPDRRLILLAIGLAIAARVPLSVGPVYYDSDMIRYVWDGRVQRLGVNPYAVVPSDPALAHTHTADTVRMPSRHDRTPYPPAAQLFFRAMVTLWESARVMKVVLTLFDIATIFLVWHWLRGSGRPEWMVLGYAWNPLVILEVAHSGHIDALGAFWIALAVLALSRRRTALAAVAYTFAVATKLLPIVLAPLFLGRVRRRDIALGVVLLALLYAPFLCGSAVPVGAVPNVVAHIRFNSPIFRPLAWIVTPPGAAAFAVIAGLAAAAWARWKLAADDPAAWAWPMAVALACAPVIYPWYLLYLTPFIVGASTLALGVWTYTVIPVYLVWEWAQYGARWRVPYWLMVIEYGLVVAAILLPAVKFARTNRAAPAPAAQP
jgi:alpha-1,6-mannosyltransferase